MNFASNKLKPTEQKLRGGYYTPVALANYVCEWALRGDGFRKILEPSVGDGNFLAALNEMADESRPLHITAVEIDSCEIGKAKRRAANFNKLNLVWKNQDFFKAYSSLERGFDAVVGNPPFIRFQHFDADSREIAFNHLKAAGYHPTKLANIWAAFVQLSIELIRPGGRLALVVPAELMQVKYASELRERITQMFDHVAIVTFQQLVFEGIQQEVVLLLAEGKRESAGNHSTVHTLELSDGDDLTDLGDLADAIAHQPEKHARKDVKWTALFLPDKAFSSLERAYRSNGIKSLGRIASVEVGIVTGRNSFFVVDTATAKSLGIKDSKKKLVGRTSSFKSSIFSNNDFKEHSAKHPCVLLDLNGLSESKFSEQLKNYIKQGELSGVHAGYKCSIRKRWFDVPSIYIPDGFLFRQIHGAPLLVANRAGATSTDTIHRVRLRDNSITMERLSAAFCNSLTFAWAEVCGRSYGGGVLELEPREAEELPIPVEAANLIDPLEVDRLLREGGVEAALKYTDPILLGEGLGLSKAEIRAINACWVQLRDRRHNRRN